MYQDKTFLEIHLKNMKYLLIVLPLILASCASYDLNLPEEKGTACLNGVLIKDDKEQVTCYPVRTAKDPVRFHKLNEVQKMHLYDQDPDLN